MPKVCVNASGLFRIAAAGESCYPIPMANVSWNPWHGCRKLSPGCLNCYVYRIDARHERDASVVKKTGDFDLPVRRNRQGEYKIVAGTEMDTCFTSDFLLDIADEWRAEAWTMIRQRPDLSFFFITKRIERLPVNLPMDWLGGYPHVTVGCTCENQAMAEKRLPVFWQAPISQKLIICEPLLGPIDLSPYLGPWVRLVAAGGESGNEARPCDFAWIESLRRQCQAAGVAFRFRQTGANFIKDGRQYRIPRKDQFSQARKANMNYYPKGRNNHE